MTYRSTISGYANAFLKRWSQVRILPGTLLFQRRLHAETIPTGPPKRVNRGVQGTKTVQGSEDEDVFSQLRRVTT